MKKGRPRILWPVAVLTAILSAATAAIFIKLAQGAGAPSISIAALRMILATGLLTPLVVARHRREIQGLSKREFLPISCAGFFLAVHFAAWISSLELTTVASSAVLVSTSPIWVGLLSPFLFKERMSLTAVIGLVLALAGSATIGLSDACARHDPLDCSSLRTLLQWGSVRGNFLALAGAWALTGYLLIGRKIRRGVSLVPYVLLVYGAAAVFLTALSVGMGISLFGYTTIAYGWIAMLAIFPQLVGHSTFNWALKHLPAAFVAVITLGEPVGAVFLAYLILNEIPTPLVLGGCVLILSGIFLALRHPA
jgi:drug/metabolite transporter (DMT)-like permease